MKILVACEESQTVCKEFRYLGHEAYSCDLLPCSGGHPEWHLQCDVREVLKQKWDLVIAHPPCTRLTNSGVCWLGKRNLWEELADGVEFFRVFVEYGLAGNKIAIENPIPHKYARDGFTFGEKWIDGIGKYTQVVQPWMFGHTERKATCFWLFGLPELTQTDNVFSEMVLLPKSEQQKIHYASPGKDRAMLRSKTFPGIAKAIAMQWGSNF